MTDPLIFVPAASLPDAWVVLGLVSLIFTMLVVGFGYLLRRVRDQLTALDREDLARTRQRHVVIHMPARGWNEEEQEP